MSMQTKSVRSYGTPYIETLGIEQNDPRELVASLEEALRTNFLRTHKVAKTRQETLKAISLIEAVRSNPTMSAMAEGLDAIARNRAEADAKWAQLVMLWRNFGKPGWLPKDEQALWNQAKEGLETLEDKLAAASYAVEKIRSRRKWKAEQTARLYSTHQVLENGEVTELPPHTKGRSHVPAYYRITSPSGRVIDLSEQEGPHKPILSSNPAEAFRRFAARLNVTRKGGDTELLNYFLKQEKVKGEDSNGNVIMAYPFLPSYVSFEVGQVWYVDVGWHRNPVVTPSNYYEGNGNDLTMEEQDNRPLTMSELEYRTISETDIVVGEEETPVYLSELEELVAEGMNRDDDHNEEDIDSWLLVDAATYMGRFIDLCQGSDITTMPEFDEAISNSVRNTLKRALEFKAKARALQVKLEGFIQLHLDVLQDPEVQKEMAAIARAKASAANRAKSIKRRLKDDLEDLQSQMKAFNDKPVTKLGWSPTPVSAQPDSCKCSKWADVAKTVGFDIKVNLQPKEIHGAGLLPANEITVSPVVEVDKAPKAKSVQVTLAQAKQLRRQKHVCRAIRNGYFPHLIREKAAQAEFARALEEALRA